MSYCVTHLPLMDGRLYPSFLPLLFTKPPRMDKWHFYGVRWIWAADCACPYPGNHCVFGAVGGFYLGIQVADTPECLVTHPFAVVADVFRESFGALVDALFIASRVHGFLPREFGRSLYKRLVDEHGPRG